MSALVSRRSRARWNNAAVYKIKGEPIDQHTRDPDAKNGGERNDFVPPRKLVAAQVADTAAMTDAEPIALLDSLPQRTRLVDAQVTATARYLLDEQVDDQKQIDLRENEIQDEQSSHAGNDDEHGR